MLFGINTVEYYKNREIYEEEIVNTMYFVVDLDYCGDMVVFDTVQDARDFIDEIDEVE